MANRKDKFPKEILLAAQHSERVTGVLACVTLAQWALESNFGRSMPQGSNNPFGIKARKNQDFVLSKTQEWNKTTQRLEPHVCKFAKYPSIEAAFIAHGELLANGRPYAKAKPFMHDWQQYIPRMGKVYATDPEYSKKLIYMINRFALYDFNLPEEQK